MSSPQYDPQLGDMAERKNRGGPFVRCLVVGRNKTHLFLQRWSPKGTVTHGTCTREAWTANKRGAWTYRRASTPRFDPQPNDTMTAYDGTTYTVTSVDSTTVWCTATDKSGDTRETTWTRALWSADTGEGAFIYARPLAPLEPKEPAPESPRSAPELPYEPTVLEFLAAQRNLTRAKRTLNAAQGAVERFQTKARDIVTMARSLSGLPKYGDPIAEGARLAYRQKWGWVVEVRIERYGGEGNYSIEKRPVIFPARWLDMPTAHWWEELRMMVARRVERDAQRAKEAAEQRRLQTEATERAQLERLLQKYPTTEGGS